MIGRVNNPIKVCMIYPHLLDFQVAIRMFAITKKPLTKADFQRAVRASTGTEFDKELVNVIFDVFDEDNDNKLGYDEFMKVIFGRF